MVTLTLKVITILLLLIFQISKQRDPDPGLRMAMWGYTDHFSLLKLQLKVHFQGVVHSSVAPCENRQLQNIL